MERRSRAPKKNGKYYQGKFVPKNIKKYRGDWRNIQYRSGWELKVFKWLDTKTSVIWWQSEELAIPYFSPVDSRYRRYFPDIVAEIRKKDGSTQIYMIEIKPYAQTQEPQKKSKLTKRYITEVATWGVNSAKWEAAQEYCESKNWIFLFVTERNLPEFNK